MKFSQVFGPKGEREGEVQKEGPGNTTKTKFTWKKRKGGKGRGGENTARLSKGVQRFVAVK